MQPPSRPSRSRPLNRPPDERTPVPDATTESLWDLALSGAFAAPREEPPLRPAEGTRFRLQAEIARGGMGVIHRAFDDRLGREVAIKTLRAELADDAAMVARFLDEARISGRLQHPGIVPVHEVGFDDAHRPYICMELVRGRTLATLLAERGSSDRDAGRFLGAFEQICQTIAYAHSRGVIHRDLKPSNVMVGAYGEIRVLDWGVAKVVHVPPREPGAGAGGRSAAGAIEATPITTPPTPGAIVGTPAYMAPEQARGDADLVDERADVYALGAILCEILTGVPPVPDTEVRAPRGAAGHVDGIASAVARLETRAEPAGIVALAKRCLEVDPNRRPRTADEVACAVADFRAGAEERARAAALAVAEAKGRALEERRLRRRTVALSVVILLCLLVAAGIVAWVERRRRSDAEHTDEVLVALAAEVEHHARLADFAAADDTLAHARRLAAAGRAGTDALAALDGSARRLSEARATGRAQRDDRDRHAASVERLGRLRRLAAGASADVVAAYAEEFRSLGIDPARGSPGDLAGALGRNPEIVRAALVLGLDDWVTRLIGEPVGTAPLRATGTRAPATDPRAGAAEVGLPALERLLALTDADPFRTRIRAALAAGDPAELRRLASETDTRDAEARSFLQLASGLARHGAVDAALRVLRRGVLVHPDDARLHDLLSRTLAPPPLQAFRGHRGARTAAFAEALASAVATRSLAPDAMAPGLRVVDLLLASGRHDEASALVAEAQRRHPGDPAVVAAEMKVLLVAARATEALALAATGTSGIDLTKSTPASEAFVAAAARLVPAGERPAQVLAFASAGVLAAEHDALRMAALGGERAAAENGRDSAARRAVVWLDVDLALLRSRIAAGRYADAVALARHSPFAADPGLATLGASAAVLAEASNAGEEVPVESPAERLVRLRLRVHRAVPPAAGSFTVEELRDALAALANESLHPSRRDPGADLVWTETLRDVLVAIASALEDTERGGDPARIEAALTLAAEAAERGVRMLEGIDGFDPGAREAFALDPRLAGLDRAVRRTETDAGARLAEALAAFGR